MLPLYTNIKLRREALNMKQEDLAELSGYAGKSAIARIENGEIDLPASRIVAIAKALKVSPGALMDGNISIDKQEAAFLSDFYDASEESRANAAIILRASAEKNRETAKKAQTA